MKIINPCVELIQQESGFDGIIRHIEKCGRTCYKSENKITQDSANKFVDKLLENKHYAMLEHGTVYLSIRRFLNPKDETELSKYEHNPYSYYNELIFGDCSKGFYVTTNYRVLVENNWLDDLQYICEPTVFHVPRITLKFTTNIGVTREGNRMRANSIAEESTRYCNYTKDKFGSGLNIVPPIWMDNEHDLFALKDWDQDQWLTYIKNVLDTKNPDFLNCDDIDWYGMAIAFSEMVYTQLIRHGWTPQQAREVLPLATKSEVVYTAFPHQWKHFFDLRYYGITGMPHPNMKAIASKARDILIANNIWKLIYPNNEAD